MAPRPRAYPCNFTPNLGALDTLRRYDISYVVRSGRLARSLPSSFCQADLDLLHPAGMAHTDRGRLLAEAEAIKAVTQVRATWGMVRSVG